MKYLLKINSEGISSKSYKTVNELKNEFSELKNSYFKNFADLQVYLKHLAARRDKVIEIFDCMEDTIKYIIDYEGKDITPELKLKVIRTIVTDKGV